GGGRREDLLEKHRRVEQSGVRIGEQRLPSRGRKVDERNLSGGERSQSDAAPRPVRDVGVSKDEPPGACDLRQEGQRKEDRDRQPGQENAPSLRHATSVQAA